MSKDIILLTGDNKKRLEEIQREFVISKLLSPLDITENDKTITEKNKKIAVVSKEELKEIINKNGSDMFNIYLILTTSNEDEYDFISKEKIIKITDNLSSESFFDICKKITSDNFQIIRGEYNNLNI